MKGFWRKLQRLELSLQRICRLRQFSMRRRFRAVYSGNWFGADESRSGSGSSLEQTATIRRELHGLLVSVGARELLDAPCGDAHWISQLDWTRINYVGVDIVPDAIKANEVRLAAKGMRFQVANICEDRLPKADVVLCRDCWVQLTFRQIAACVENFRCSGATYLLATTFHGLAGNIELEPGAIWRPLNLQRPPFCFPDPERLLVEGCTESGGNYADKALALWRLAALPAVRVGEYYL